MPLVEKRLNQSFRPYSEAESEGEDETFLGERHQHNLYAALASKEFDPVTFEFLKVPALFFASQLTLLDIRAFKAIEPDELTSCGWNTKDKLTVSPHVVAFIQRFNQVCLWSQKEILSRQSVKTRTEVLSHFIKIAKCLRDMNNLHSCFAIVSGLNSNPIYRLRKTWGHLPGNQKNSFDKMVKLFSEEKNWEKLRKHTNGMKLPCIPYLGLYLTDLVYIDVAHPTQGGLANSQRSLKMNNILRILADFQDSNYDQLGRLQCVQDYLQSVQYIDELQKFVEDENFKKSLSLEPAVSSSSSKDSLKRRESLPVHSGAVIHKSSDGTIASSPSGTGAPNPHKTQSLTPKAAHFKPSHRKTHSLGASTHPLSVFPPSAGKKNQSFGAETANPLGDCHRHLLDDSLLDVDSSCTPSSSLGSAQIPFELPDESDLDSVDGDGGCGIPGRRGTGDSGILSAPETTDKIAYTMQGPVKRKTLLRNGKRPTMSSWNRYWLGLWGTNLFYFSPRSIPSRDSNSRGAFKVKLCKMLSISGWMVVMGEDPFNPDTFQLQEPSRGNVYKFRAGSQAAALDWVKALKTAAESHKQSLPANLMSFE